LQEAKRVKPWESIYDWVFYSSALLIVLSAVALIAFYYTRDVDMEKMADLSAFLTFLVTGFGITVALFVLFWQIKTLRATNQQLEVQHKDYIDRRQPRFVVTLGTTKSDRHLQINFLNE